MIEKPAKETSLISSDPAEVLASGNYHKVPVLIGYCKDEGIFSEAILKRVKKEAVHDDFEDLIHYRFEAKKGSELSRTMAGKIKKFYYPERESAIDQIQAFYDVSSLSADCFVSI